MALISKGIKLYYKPKTLGPDWAAMPETPDETYGYELPGLQEIGELSTFGGGFTRDKIEVTTLADDRHVYTDGLISESDMAGITFKFLFDAGLFKWFKDWQNYVEQMAGLEGAPATRAEQNNWFVVLPDGTAFNMKADITDAKLDGAGVGAALTMTATLTPFEAITVAVKR
jgi:hypothetical protein